MSWVYSKTEDGTIEALTDGIISLLKLNDKISGVMWKMDTSRNGWTSCHVPADEAALMWKWNIGKARIENSQCGDGNSVPQAEDEKIFYTRMETVD